MKDTRLLTEEAGGGRAGKRIKLYRPGCSFSNTLFSVNQQRSDRSHKAVRGVPQGSTSGPVLFSLCVVFVEMLPLSLVC